MYMLTSVSEGFSKATWSHVDIINRDIMFTLVDLTLNLRTTEIQAMTDIYMIYKKFLQ